MRPICSNPKGNKDFECRDSLDSIAVSIFVDILVELTNAVSEAKIQITYLIVRRGALSRIFLREHIAVSTLLLYFPLSVLRPPPS